MSFDKLESKHIAYLIWSDLVTCARYYHHCTKSFRKLCSKDKSILGHLDWFFFITEFQHRGSEHDHGLLWIENAPIYDIASNATIGNFINKYISYDSHILTPNFCKAQIHFHKKTCRKKNQIICRFNNPWPPMEETRILNPLSKLISFIDKTCLTNINTQVFNSLNNMCIETTMSFLTFLYSLSINKQTYIDLLRIKFKKSIIFLQRAYRDIRTNPFGIHAGNIWQANTDL